MQTALYSPVLWFIKSLEPCLKFELDLTLTGGYDGRTNQERWTFPSALMFSLSVFTMIGFGHLVPRTQWGKIATMLYAVVGIPVYVLYFMNMGQVLASCFKWFYCKIVTCAVDARNKDAAATKTAITPGSATSPVTASVAASAVSHQHKPPPDQMLSSATGLMEDDLDSGLIIVPSTACLWVWLTYLATGTIMFAEWENWDYLDACYFCVTSLCKIGMGDFVPGANLQAAGNQTKLVNVGTPVSFQQLITPICLKLLTDLTRTWPPTLGGSC